MTHTLKKYFLNRPNALRCIIELWIEEIKDSEKRKTERDQEVINIPIDDENDSNSIENSASNDSESESEIEMNPNE